ncbi:hypothetical protein K8R20_01245 [bacterium]|nr:hypothetical protein [bacterium]
MMKKYYKAQALAIVMVVLVVASIIGVSLFSRMSKDSQSAINQQDSALAEEQSDGILDIFVGSDVEILEAKIREGVGPFENISDSEFSTFISDIGGDPDALPDENVGCLEDSSSIKVTIGQSDEGDFVEIQQGSVRVYNLTDATIVAPCVLTWRFRPVSDSSAFLVEYIMNDGSVVTQSEEHYCITSDGAACNTIDNVEYLSSFLNTGDMASVGAMDGEGAYARSIDLVVRFAADVKEIRVIPIAGTLSVADTLSDLSCIDKEFRSIKIRSEVNCNGSYRGKQMFLPGSGNLGYSPLFDYAIYDNGLFQP